VTAKGAFKRPEVKRKQRRTAIGRTRIKLPAETVAKVGEFAASGGEPVVPRNSATVMLLRPATGRDGPGPDSFSPGGSSADRSGLEVYMLRRRRSMSFAAGAYVFPGGSVDSRDSDGELSWAGPSVEQWAAALDCPPGLARGLVCAAVRETFEEAGVLLAGASADDPAVPPGADLEPDRLALLDGSLSLAGLLARRGLVLRTDLLKPWARWITPDLEPRRFDTRFFAALLPAGQQTAEIRDEADQVAWLRPADVLAAGARREVNLMPPTAITLAELAACPDIAAVFAAKRPLTSRQPMITLEDGQAWLTLPEDLELPYPREPKGAALPRARSEERGTSE
jgi:8-oxo-dGTP pyrophosphatase MutT (NUDIX family)